MRSRVLRVWFNGLSSISKVVTSSGYEAHDVGRTTQVPEEPFFMTSSLALLATQIPSLSSSVSVSFRQQCMIFPENHALLPKAYFRLERRAYRQMLCT